MDRLKPDRPGWRTTATLSRVLQTSTAFYEGPMRGGWGQSEHLSPGEKEGSPGSSQVISCPALHRVRKSGTTLGMKQRSNPAKFSGIFPLSTAGHASCGTLPALRLSLNSGAGYSARACQGGLDFGNAKFEKGWASQ
jgi:hypothetical protein